MTINKTYIPETIEQKWYQHWEQQNYFQASGNGPSFCLMIPPPNVTGQLHMGHGFQYALMDCLVRYHRMCGHNTLWQVGSDHAGIATQMVVERQLMQQQLSRHDLGRDAFVNKVWEWKQQSGDKITQQMRRIGISVDWQRERFTMDAELSAAVQQVFIKLYDEGLIYRGKRLVNWDPKLLTAISDLEVIAHEEQGQIYHIRYPLLNQSGSITIATTRPETIFADAAVAVHPKDSRYQHLIQARLQLPLTERNIPIIADEYVDPDFGTGCLKVTPAHDFNDYQIGLRHQLPILNILTPTATLNTKVPKQYQGLNRFTARSKIIEDLQQNGLLEKIEQHTLSIPRGDRSGVIIEPYLTNQWYVKMHELAQPALKAVQTGKIKFIPKNWQNTYFRWLENIEDWCISRQLWWGHRIPAWYDPKGKIYIAANETDARKKYSIDPDIPLHQDPDVLDTWFSSALWPFSTLGWPESTPELQQHYPTSVLVTGFDIIFFWVARMIMFGLKFTDDIPFKQVYITGLIRDSNGHKMSKSKGNIIDPIDLIDGISLEELLKKRTQAMMQPEMTATIQQQTKQEFPNGIDAYGTDALRFTFCALASTGRDIRFDLGRLAGYRNFCTKLWNAGRYILMHAIKPIITAPKQLNLIDHWIIARLQQTIANVTIHIQQYRFDLIAQTLYDFTWNEFCDWYLELSKPILNDKSSANALAATQHTLVNVFETILRLLHPIIPFITEELWQKIAPIANVTGKTIMLQPYPKPNNDLINKTAIDDIEWIKQIIIGLRTIRAEMNIAPKQLLTVLIRKEQATDRKRIQANKLFLIQLANLKSIELLKEQTAPAAATATVGKMELLIPLAGLIDQQAELERLNKKLEKLQQELSNCNNKLSNKNFVARAPDAIVKQEQQRQQTLKETISMLQQQLAKLKKL